MIRRPPTRLPTGLLVTASLDAADAVAGTATFVAFVAGVAGTFVAFVTGAAAGVVTGAATFGVGVLIPRVRGRGHSVRVRCTRSSGLSGGLGWLRISLGGTLRRLLQACTSVDRLVDYLLDRAVEKLPAAASARFAEEWQDHRQHYSGWRLVWWALCVRATALRTIAALGPTRLPRDS